MVIDQAPATDVAETPNELDLLCESCGYSLLGITTSKCPECGKKFDPDELPLARVPWLQRKRSGTWSAYWRTVWMILFTPRKFVRELARPVRISPTDASRFRKLTIRFASVGTAVVALAVVVATAPIGSPFGNPLPLMIAFAGMVCCFLALTLFLRLATDLPVFIWDNLPGMRAFDLAPVQQYACAPFAFLPAVAVLAFPIAWVLDLWTTVNGPIVYIAAACAALIGVWMLALLIIPLIMMRAAINARALRILALAVYLPFHYFAMAAVTGAIVFAIAGGMIIVTENLLKWLGISP